MAQQFFHETPQYQTSWKSIEPFLSYVHTERQTDKAVLIVTVQRCEHACKCIEVDLNTPRYVSLVGTETAVPFVRFEVFTVVRIMMLKMETV
jgi:molecular chaperone DnaK (HSP70)